MAAQADGPTTYILSFKSNRIPADLDASVAKVGGTVAYRHEPTGIVVVAGLEGASAAVLSAHGELEAMDAGGYTRLDQRTRTLGKMKKDAKNPSEAEGFFLQWNMNAVRAPEAWANNRLGSRKVEIGILDTGIDYLHPEFTGILDVARSVSFIPVAEEPVEEGTLRIADFSGHGTLVANIAASNAITTAGVTSMSRLVAIKVCKQDETCEVARTLLGVLYAADQKLDVINISIGGILERRGKKVEPGPSLIKIIEKVFRYAHRRGVTVVVATDNNARNMDANRKIYNLYCDVPDVICVSATGPTMASVDADGFLVDFKNVDTPAFYTDFGRRVDVAAPGGSVVALTGGGFDVAWIYATCSGFIPLCAVREEGNVLGVIGASFSAPHVAGLAALLASEGRFRGDPDRIAARIRRSATDCGAPGFDVYCGHGQINVFKALSEDGNRDGHGVH